MAIHILNTLHLLITCFKKKRWISHYYFVADTLCYELNAFCLLGKVHDLVAPYKVGDLPLDGEGNLIMAQLPATGDNEAMFGRKLKQNGMDCYFKNSDVKDLYHMPHT